MSSARNNISAMIEGALCIALSVVLTKVNLFKMPNGGSVDLELVPLMLFAFRHGVKFGVGTGALCGIVKILTGGYFFNVIQVFLDYPLAYAFSGLSGFKIKILGILMAASGQIISHVISGAVFFAEYAPAGQNAWLYSLIYNAPVITVKYVLSGFIAMILCKALNSLVPSKKN